MGTKYDIEWQEWDGHNGFIHEYQQFDYDALLKRGRTDVLARYEDCLRRFKALSHEEQLRGIIFGGAFFDFSFSLEDVEDGKKED